MLFKDIPTKSLEEVIGLIKDAKDIVFVSAKGLDGIKMPLKGVRDKFTSRISKETVFVPITDSWKTTDSFMAKDLALKLKEDIKSPFPVIMSVSSDRYERFQDNEMSNAFTKDNAIVVRHDQIPEKKVDEYRAFHHVSKEMLGYNKVIKIFPEHIATVMGIAKGLAAIPKVFLDAGSGFMVYDQAKHYLETGVVKEVVAMFVTLAKSEKEVIPYIYDNAENMGIVEGKPDLKVITKDPVAKKVSSKVTAKRSTAKKESVKKETAMKTAKTTKKATLKKRSSAA